jgi:DNA-directed RNA polymerase subunit RPC12/RpoP
MKSSNNVKSFKEFNENLNISDVRSSDIKCTFCGHKAIYETLTNNNYLCDDNDCKLQYVDEIIRELK